MIPTEPIWIAQDQELAELCARWRQQAAIAIDTEFMRSETFYPIAGLIQVGDGRGCYLIDPLAITDFSPLRELLLDSAVTKVLHSCSEDLEVFQRLLDLVPSPLFDTQIAAAFAGYGFSLGYAGLVKAVLNIDVPKEETRSDWLQRPLSVAQLKYAALDVAHMLVVYGKLLQQLKATGRLQWVKEDCADLVTNARQPDDFTQAYRKVGFAWKLRSQELATLQQLCIWRETEARERNVPRNRLVKEPVLWEIARRQPSDLEQLQRIRDLPPRTLRDYGEQLLAIVAASGASDPASWPERLPPPLAIREAAQLKRLKKHVRDLAEKLDMPVEIFVRKKEYEELLRSGLHSEEFVLPSRLQGWRFEVVGQTLLALAQEALPVIDETDHESHQ
jgi:ribonuclease D